MKVLVYFLLAGYAARCDDNYYVVQMGADFRRFSERKHLEVYWNVPTMQCRSKGVHFDDLYERFGIVQNKRDSFRGEKVTILYDPGLFPALLKNESSGKFKFRNGGVPQEGDLSIHLDAFRHELDQSIPDKDFDGVGIIDFESWRPVFRQNFGVLLPYKDVSLELERNRHRLWPKKWVEEEAKRRFESSGRTFMESTLRLARQLRPAARWGYYGFPYCFNMASNNMREECAKGVPEENDRLGWLWQSSSALFPSVYSSASLPAARLAALVRGRVREAARAGGAGGGAGGGGAPVLPYFWYKYRDVAQFLKQEDLDAVLKTFHSSNASGFIVWGSSNDVNTVQKCNKLHDYIYNTFGPAISQYTKHGAKTQTTQQDPISDLDISETTILDNVTFTTENRLKIFDPEYNWTPPNNYTQDIKDRVEEEITKKLTNYTKTDDTNASDNSVLIDLILNSLYNTNISYVENTTKNNIDGEIYKIENISDILFDPVSTTTEKFTTYSNLEQSELSIHSSSSDFLGTTNVDKLATSTETDIETTFIPSNKELKKNYIQNRYNQIDFDELEQTLDTVSTTKNYYWIEHTTEYLDKFSEYTAMPYSTETEQSEYPESNEQSTTTLSTEFDNLRQSTTEYNNEFSITTTDEVTTKIAEDGKSLSFITTSQDNLDNFTENQNLDSIGTTTDTLQILSNKQDMEMTTSVAQDQSTITKHFYENNYTTETPTISSIETTSTTSNSQNAEDTTSFLPDFITKETTTLNIFKIDGSTTESLLNLEDINNATDLNKTNGTTEINKPSTSAPDFELTEDLSTTVEENTSTSTTNQVVVYEVH